jgi:hypothetical protein
MDESFLGERDDTIKITPKELVQVSTEPITRLTTNKLKNTVNELIYNIWNNVGFKEATSISEDQTLVNLIHA